jgi:hypothetical protein
MKLKVLVLILFYISQVVAQESKLTEAKPIETKASEISSTESKSTEAKSKVRKEVTNNAMSISYGSAKWNADPKAIDSASIIFRDAKTGKTALIIVDETAPDSATFQGKYLIRWGDGEQIIPEIYVPPQELVKKSNWMKEFNDKVKSGGLKRKPFLSRKSDRGERVYDVFDTKEQAEVASKAREEAKKLEQEAKEAKPTPQMEKALSKVAAAALIEAEKLAQIEAEKLRLAAEEASREAERARLAQIEKQKEEERKRKAAELDAAEKARRKAQATKLSEQGMAAYTAGDFPKAESLFQQSIELDPSTKNYYYFYGIALFRNNKNNQSIVILQQVEAAQNIDLVERDYYIGLNYFKLKEAQNSLEIFRKIKTTNHNKPQDPFSQCRIL